jgi:hypothetical protein
LDGTALEGTDLCRETATELQRTEEDQNAEEDHSPSTDRSSASGSSSKRVTQRPSEDADGDADEDADEDAEDVESVAVTITAAETGDAGSEIPDSQAPESSRLSDVGAPTDAASDAASVATEETAPQETEPTPADALEKTAETSQADNAAATEVMESTEDAQ